jgi:phosphoribosylformylglycinamidine cyclo-ligase
MYNAGDYDLAGFCVGIVEKRRLIQAERVRPGDVLIGLASSGPHSNGYSLIRKILQVTQADLAQSIGATSLGDALLAPTRIYVKPLLQLMEQIEIHALAHITGGGLPDNLPRVLPNGCKAVIERGSWQLPAVFHWLQQQGNVAETEMLRTFNCGVGMVLCVGEADAQTALHQLQAAGEEPWRLGRIEATEDAQPSVEIRS